MMELIVNPIAGHGRSLQVLADTERELISQGVPYHISKTNGVGHATKLAAKAVSEGADSIAVLGGDGLLSEVCEAIYGKPVTLYFIPCGTGNDFVKTLKLPKDPVKALRLQLSSEKRKIDCGAVNEYFFLNVAGLGFDIEVLTQTELFKRRSTGIRPYLNGLITGLHLFKPIAAKVSLDGIEEAGEYTIISVANGRFFGGGMPVAPLADPQDGLFDVMLVEALPKWKFYLMVPVFLFGQHLNFKFVRRVLAEKVHIQSGDGFLIEADGELKEVKEALFVCHPKSITIACP